MKALWNRLLAKISRKRKVKQQVLKETARVDFTNITHDWEKSKRLYDELKKKCHPDKFSDELNEEATRIFQLLVKNKYKYQNLLTIKEEAIEKLGIKMDDEINI